RTRRAPRAPTPRRRSPPRPRPRRRRARRAGTRARSGPGPRRRRAARGSRRRDLEANDRAERERAQPHALAVVGGEAPVDIREPEPRALPHTGLEHTLDRLARDAAAVVAHRHAQPPATA